MLKNPNPGQIWESYLFNFEVYTTDIFTSNSGITEVNYISSNGATSTMEINSFKKSFFFRYNSKVSNIRELFKEEDNNS